MTALDRTAYPRLRRQPSARELAERFTPTAEELALARGPASQLCFLALLKTFQQLGYFPRPTELPLAILQHLRTVLGLPPDVAPDITARTRYKHHEAIRAQLGIRADPRAARHVAIQATAEAARVLDHPADLVNVALEALARGRYELPAFSTLDRLVGRVRALVNGRFHAQVWERLSDAERARLERLLEPADGGPRTPYHDLKQLPKRPSRSHLQQLLDHLDWLITVFDARAALVDLPPAKIRHFAAECKALDAAELKDVAPRKRLTLLLCLLQQAQQRARDDLADLLIKRMRQVHTAAQEDLVALRARQREATDELVATLAEVLEVLEEDPDDDLAARGEVPLLLGRCAAVRAVAGDNYLPLLWPRFRSHRATLCRLARTLTFRSTTQERALVQALALLLAHHDRDGKYLPVEVDLSFASEPWQRAVVVGRGRRRRLLRRPFEVCVFTYLAAELRSGDVSIDGSGAYADYREQLLPWSACAPLVADYAREIGLPETADGFVAQLRTWLDETARAVDAGVPSNTALELSPEGRPSLKRPPRPEPRPAVRRLEAALLDRLPERPLLDVLCNVEHWTHWTRHFGPRSGSEPKLERAAERYLLTTFAYGCNLGPAQAARHLGGAISAHTLSFVNRRHVSAQQLEAALRDLINTYHRFGLPKHWGAGKAAAADGTQYDLYEENLIAEYHPRYGAFGGIAYHHVADSYIALFSHFIPCGVWEAIYILEGLLKNTSDVQPDTVHADTQGQSAPVFALAHLLGIQLMPRIRNWKDLTFYRPTKEARYAHLDPLFTEVVDWKLIETHWQDLLQVALSVRAGKLSSAVLLRKLGVDSRKNRLYQAFRELGRVVRTAFLLRYLSEPALRAQIQADTNKVEAYNGFASWCFFGGDGVIAENDPEEQEKRIKYNDLVANAIIFQNVVDMTYALRDLVREGYPVTRADVAALSPDLTKTIRRFGAYTVNLDTAPLPLDGELALPLPEEPEEAAERPA